MPQNVDATDRVKLSGLFRFAQGVLAAREQVQLRMQDTGLGCFSETEMRDLPGIALNVDADNWLVLQRLRETRPPDPDEMLAEWLEGLVDDPAKTPRFKSAIVREVDIDEASDLCEAGFLSMEDVYRISGDATASDAEGGYEGGVKIALRLENLGHLKAGLEEWRDGVWEAWAAQECRVRKSIQLYNSFFKLHNMMHGGAVGTPPELVWGIGLARWKFPQATIDMPLIEQLVDLDVQEGGALTIKPREVRPGLSLKPFLHVDVEGSFETQRYVQALFDTITDSEVGEITPFDAGVWENLLDLAATRLSSRARHVTLHDIREGAEVKAPGDDLVIYSTWSIFGRPRSESIREQDLEQLRKKIDQTERDDALPVSIRGFVAPQPASAAPADDDWGLSRTVLGSGAEWGGNGAKGSTLPDRVRVPRALQQGVYFFPLPYNEEQAKIIDRLDANDVVTVTGPPGTGKTHTIANIIAHFMATGKRVLVTARTAEAIAAVREKLPKDLASLVIASVASDREGVKHLEEAIQRLSDDVVSLDAAQTIDDITHIEADIVAIDEQIRSCDRRLADIAAENLTTLSWGGEERTAMELAEEILRVAPANDWMTDRPANPPPASLDAVVGRLRAALPRIGEDILYLEVELPDPGDLPAAVELIEAHDFERTYRSRPTEDFSGEPEMARDSEDAEACARDAYAALDGLRLTLVGSSDWERSFAVTGLAAGLAGDPAPDVGRRTTAAWALINERRPGRIELEANGAELAKLIEAAERGMAGKRVRPTVAGIFNRRLTAAVESIRVDGNVPDGTESWARIFDSLKILEIRPEIDALWLEDVEAGRLPPVPETPDELFAVVRDVEERLQRIKTSVQAVVEQAPRLTRLFPYGIDLNACLIDLRIERVQKALRANLNDEYQPPDALTKLASFASRGEQPVYAELAALRDALGKEDIGAPEIVAVRTWVTQEIVRLRKLSAEFEMIGSDLTALRGVAPDWAAASLAEPAHADRILRADWRQAWEWAVMRGRLDRIISLGNGDTWREQKMELRRRRERQFESLIRARTLLGLKKRLTGPVQTALATFTSSIRRLGRGTGKSAVRWRRAIRRAAIDAAPAAPVWIMPEYKIAEQLPAELGDFDLVILDEASQSDVTAIGALARGKKLLIVGDEQQVSPSAVGVPQNKIDVLRAEHLAFLPNKEVIDENTSIFEIAMQMYPSTHLMLREHFRCAEPIIQFSTRFYSGRLIPIRVPKPSERFDPPLVDVLVTGAERRGKTNEAEARFIVDEIAAIASDPSHANRDVAVISLIGGEQAELIERKLIDDPRVGTETMERLRIICGDSRTMQGQERSIVFLSMVSTRETARTQSTQGDGQRFNVALSRARDRLYLVHSVTSQDLKQGDLKLAVLQHFADPMPEGRAYAGDGVLERCESGFEREVCERLINAGYRVRAQVKAGPFRIDLVVEGADDRRLAIELDGDAWHGPERWEQDMARQSALERAGWTFWRVFGSQWVSDRDHWQSNLFDRLRVMGIEPIGAEASGEIFTESRVFNAALGSEVAAVALVVDAAGGADIELDSAVSVASETAEPGEDTKSVGLRTLDSGDHAPGVSDPIALIEERTNPIAPTVVVRLKPVTTLDPHDVGVAIEVAPAPVPDSERFYDQDYRITLRAMIREIVDASGPMTFKHLCDRIARAHGFQRTGSEIKKTIQDGLGDARAISHGPGDDRVVWPETLMVSEWVQFRGLESGGVKRDWGDVPLPEKLGLAREIVTRRVAQPSVAMGEAIGVQRLRRRTREEIETLLETATAMLAEDQAASEGASNVSYFNQRFR